jgi:glutamine amidotransferase
MLQEGLDGDPQGALSRAAGCVIDASRRAGLEPALKLTAAFSDGERLHAVRYASEGHAPTLYAAATMGGRCLVSEPFDREGAQWHEVPPGSFVTMTRDSVTIRPFAPEPSEKRLALAG